MQLVERHVVNQYHSLYKELDKLCFLSKNLYNYANYLIRQEVIKNSKYLNYTTIQKQLQSHPDYKALPAKVSQQVLRLLDKNWKSFFEAKKEYAQNPDKFLGEPKLPKYKDKIKGRNVVVYTAQAVSKTALMNVGLIKLSQSDIAIKSQVKYKDLCQVRVVPKLNHYVIEVVYNYLENSIKLDRNKVAGVDLGVNNLATVTSNLKGFQPLVVNGRPLKSINQYFNKKKASLQSKLGNKTSNKLQKLCSKRGFKVDDYLHKSSRLIINKLVEKGIGTLVIGKNDSWKQESNIGKRNNQNFVQIPHDRLVHQLKYKAELSGISVVVCEESYTSKASFLDLDTIPTYKQGNKHTFSGKRIQRGMYRSQSGRLINADVNGSYNIIRKAVANAFSNAIEDVVVHPVVHNITN